MAKKRSSVKKTENTPKKKNASELTGGKSIFSLLSEEDPISKVKHWFPTGLPLMDTFLSDGRGIPGGKLIEVFGNFSTGKTALCHYFIQMIHRLGGWAVFIDFESTLDDEHLSCYKDIDLSRVLYSAPETIEDAWGGIFDFIDKSKDYSPFIICLDSVSAGVPKAELGDVPSVAPLARAMSRNLRKLILKLAGKPGFAYFTNQVRTNIGAISFDKTTRPGGHALDFYSDIIIKSAMKKNLTKTVNGVTKSTGYLIELTSKKNRKAAPRAKYEFVLSFNRGVDVPETILHTLLKNDIARKRGNKIVVGEKEYSSRNALIAAIDKDSAEFMKYFG